MADQRFLYSEELVGANHGTKADTINRLALVDHNNDGTHKEYIVRARMSAAQTIPNAELTVINWNAEDEDTVGAHSTTVNNSRITIPAGFRRADLHFYGIWVANTTGTRLGKILKNGTIEICPDEKSMPSTLGYGPLHSFIMGYPVVENDFFQTLVYHSKGGDLNFDAQSFFFARLYK